MPCTLREAGLAGFSGTVQFTRRFGVPRTFDPEEHLWLVFHPQAISIQVSLNEKRLAEFAGAGEFAAEATGLLRERNILEVSLQAADDGDGLTGETWLEIRRASYLRRPTAKRLADGRIQAAVELAGEVEAGLEVYVLALGRTIAYWRTVQVGEQSAELVTEEPASMQVKEVRIELILGGIVWYVAECEVI